MAYRYGDRKQRAMFPKSIEEYVPEDAPVRVYDAFVESLDFETLGFKINPHKVGNSTYDPKAMLKLLVYGYSYGIKSSRKLERESHYNLSFIWLMGGLKPDHKTIAEFRRKNKETITKVLGQCARLCIKLNLISGNVLFVDGTKIRANAGRDKTHTKAWYEKQLSKIDQRIEELLNDCESIDNKEKDQDSYIAVDKKLAKAKDLKDRIKKALGEIEENDIKSVNMSDPDCSIMRSIQGSHASYNVQSVVDDENGLIVHAEATNAGNDSNQFSKQIDHANKILDEPCEIACADAGYSNTEELKKINDQGITVVVPSQRQALHKDEGPFSKGSFIYDKENNNYYCPKGHKLRQRSIYEKKGQIQYKMVNKQNCLKCEHFGLCTKSKQGRTIVRLINEEFREKFERQYEEKDSQVIYNRRKIRVEHPFGHIKRNLKTDSFMLRGLEGVQAETSLLGTCFNLARMINLLGAPKLIEAIQSVCQKSENRYQKTSVKGYKKGDWHLNDLQISESKYQHHFGMLRNFYLLICQRANKLEKYFHNSKIEANFI